MEILTACFFFPDCSTMSVCVFVQDDRWKEIGGLCVHVRARACVCARVYAVLLRKPSSFPGGRFCNHVSLVQSVLVCVRDRLWLLDSWQLHSCAAFLHIRGSCRPSCLSLPLCKSHDSSAGNREQLVIQAARWLHLTTMGLVSPSEGTVFTYPAHSTMDSTHCCDIHTRAKILTIDIWPNRQIEQAYKLVYSEVAEVSAPSQSLHKLGIGSWVWHRNYSMKHKESMVASDIEQRAVKMTNCIFNAVVLKLFCRQGLLTVKLNSTNSLSTG